MENAQTTSQITSYEQEPALESIEADGFDGMKATYSPDDNKLRIYSEQRLDSETYARVKAAGFVWAAKQGFFVAPMWTPQREDLAVELCGELQDEDTTLAERAEDRAERFSGYSASRAGEAESVRSAARKIADHIPFGQPILVGHHSEGRHRRDAKRIQEGFRKSAELWQTSEHWQRRAAAAIANAKHKEAPAVRARRIARIEADKRKQERARNEAELFMRLWNHAELTRDKALAIAGRDHVYIVTEAGERLGGLWSLLNDGKVTVEDAITHAVRAHTRAIAWAARWIGHYDARLAYERAMLADQGGTDHDKKPAEKGGAIRCLFSPHYGRGWAYVVKVNKVSVTIEEAAAYGGRKFTRNIPFDKIVATMTAAELAAAREAGRVADTQTGEGFMLAEAN